VIPLPGFNWINDPNPGAVNLYAMEDRLPTDVNMLIQNTAIRLIPYIRATSDRNYLAESRHIHLALAPYLLAAKLYRLPEPFFFLNQIRISDTHEILNYREPQQLQDGYQITVTEISSTRGVPIKDAFALIPITSNRTLVMALTLDVTSYIRVEKISDTHWHVLCNKLSHGLMLRIASIIPIMFPLYRNDAYVPEQLPILLAQDSYDRYIQTFMNWAMPIYTQAVQDLRWTELRNGLQAIRSSQLSTITQRIDQLNQEMNGHLESLRYLQESYNETILMKFGFENSPAEQYDDLFNYIKRNRYIHNIQDTGTPGKLMFTVSVPLSNWNVEQAEQLLTSGISNNLNTPEDQRAACYDLLIKQEATMYFSVCFALNFITGAANKAGFDTAAPGIPNRHIHQHDCWGNNANAIQRAVRNNQLEAAFEQALSACGSLNMADGTVTSGMFRALREQQTNYNRKCILIDPALEMLTWAEYVEHVRVKNLPAPAPVTEEVPDETDADNEY